MNDDCEAPLEPVPYTPGEPLAFDEDAFRGAVLCDFSDCRVCACIRQEGLRERHWVPVLA